jgi:hypothetical protein
MPRPKKNAESAEAANITKAEAVRRALAQGHAMPTDGVAFIKSEFGIDMGIQHFSAQKSQLKKQKGAKKKVGRPAKHPQPSMNGGAGILEAMEAMKPLVASMGANKLKRLVDLLG